MDEEYKKEIIKLTGTTWEMPQDIGEWLGRLLLLYGVPFNYLVPEEQMLPPESIRFFYLDPGWMNCVLEGACSVGKSSSLDELFDQNLRNRFLDLAGQKASEVRTGKSEKLNWPVTGFLLRSDLVEGWQGLEMRASGVDGQGNHIDPLQPLRIDRLSPDIMLCLFNGKVTEIEVKQPLEGLHFGAAANGNNGYVKYHLRKLPAEVGEQIAAEAGEQIKDENSAKAKEFNIAVPMHDKEKRVVNVQELASLIETSLGEFKPNGPFTSAEFAVEMVESPGKAVFKAP
jgi:hypothetical protein